MTEELIDVLDARGERWELGRIHGGKWMVRLGPLERDDPAVRTFHAATIEAALQAAVDDGPPLPLVPRRPDVFDRAKYQVRKSGGKWSLYYGESSHYSYLESKAKAERIADRDAALSADQANRWDLAYGEQVRNGVEGVTFRWAR